ncbi:MAG: nitroreductase family protein [Deltaproteobacteria bacterium]|nr:nitroreductase family protein [Deltaproteobacteria bacterium]
MELKEVIGRRRSIRFIDPDRPVERAKIQKMLEAARLASFWGNVQALKAVAIERASAPQEVIDALPIGTAIGGFQFRAAPVVIVWLLDWNQVTVQGDRLHELVDAGALGVNVEKSHAYLDSTLIPFFQLGNEKIRTAGITEVDCGQGIAQATLVAFEEGLGTCLLGVMNDRKLKRVLRLPADSKVLVVQTVGYPKEDPEAGGQRPRIPFEQRFFLNRFGDSFRRDENVVHELQQAKMLQRPAPTPGRRDELRALAKDYGLGDIFGDEVPAIIADMTQAAEEDGPEAAK